MAGRMDSGADRAASASSEELEDLSFAVLAQTLAPGTASGPLALGASSLVEAYDRMHQRIYDLEEQVKGLERLDVAARAYMATLRWIAAVPDTATLTEVRGYARTVLLAVAETETDRLKGWVDESEQRVASYEREAAPQPGEVDIQALLRQYIDAGCVAAREEDAAGPYADTDPDSDRAWERVADLRTQIGLYIVGLEDAAAQAREAEGRAAEVVERERAAFVEGCRASLNEPPQWEWQARQLAERLYPATPQRAGGPEGA